MDKWINGWMDVFFFCFVLFGFVWNLLPRLLLIGCLPGSVDKKKKKQKRKKRKRNHHEFAS